MSEGSILPPTHASKTPWKTTAANPEWEELMDYYLRMESYIPDEALVSEIKAAYLEYAPHTLVNWFRKQAETEDGWRRFLGCLYAGVPVDYTRVFNAFYDRTESSDVHEYHASDVQLAHELSIPQGHVVKYTAPQVKATLRVARELAEKGVPSGYVAAAMPLTGFDADLVREHWDLGIPIEYLGALLKATV